jgi:hypothetical protein
MPKEENIEKKGHEDVKHFFEYYHNSFHGSSRCKKKKM